MNHLGKLCFLFSISVIFYCCISPVNDVEFSNSYLYEKPEWNKIGIAQSDEYLHFNLDSITYNSIKSFNVFKHRESEYISFYDDRSKSINIYNLNGDTPICKLYLKRILGERKIYKPTIYLKNFDSIYVSNYSTLYLIDSLQRIVDSLDYLSNPPFAWGFFSNSSLPLFFQKIMYVPVRPYMDDESLKSVGNWKILYRLDFSERKVSLHYKLPPSLRKNYYGHRFLEYSICYNTRKNFVFSFSGDSLVYESNQSGYHKAYLAKSKYQETGIKPVSKAELLADHGYDNYLMRDSYGAIYYDHYTHRYLRVVNSKLSSSDYAKGQRKKPHSLLIMDEELKVIGESRIDSGISLSSLFVSRNGNIYARTKIEDQYAIHFIRLKYMTLK